MIINSNNPCNLNADEAEHAIALSSGVIKLICGVANSVAELVCLIAYDEIKKHPKFRHLAKHCFNNAMKGFKTYKANLVNPSGMRFFHLDDLPPVLRREFAESATDRDYFDFWLNNGAVAYEKVKETIFQLKDTYNECFAAHNIPNGETLAWAHTACGMLKIADYLYNYALRECTAFKIPLSLLKELFNVFSIHVIYNYWNNGTEILYGRSEELTEIEKDKILNSITELRNEIINPDNLYGANISNIFDYDEIYANKGSQEKAMSVMENLMTQTNNNINNETT